MIINAGLGKTELQKVLYKGINCKNAGAVQLSTIPAGNKIFVAFWGGVAIRQAVGVTGAPTISLGTNPSNYNDIAQAAALTGLTQGNVAPVQFRTQYPLLLAGVSTFVNVSVAAVATTYNIDLLFLGVWV